MTPALRRRSSCSRSRASSSAPSASARSRPRPLLRDAGYLRVGSYAVHIGSAAVHMGCPRHGPAKEAMMSLGGLD
eukprot:372901-Alexandrium_andersonii.AAC.1